MVDDLAWTGVFDAAGVDSYRARLVWTTEGECRVSCNSGRVEGEFTRDASRVWGYGGEEVIKIGAETWHREFPGALWAVGDPYGFGESAPHLSFAWAVPAMTSLQGQQVLGDISDHLLEVGGEMINGRSTVHLRVDRAGFERAAADSGHRFFDNEARLDVWIDQLGQFPVKWELATDGPGFAVWCWGDCSLSWGTPLGGDTSAEWSLELYDFDADITIDAPAT